ncbi:MAG: prolipoprotein diacylglyceryl transferase [Paludibacter sp.]|nr:prolipoprotein diacylglyceryl transferase [Paludibacter sp.]
MLNYITWNVDPELFRIGSLHIRWYGLLWALGIWLTLVITQKIYKHEKLSDQWLDKLFIYTVIGAVVGARLGHCLFYNPSYYLARPWEILFIWQGGLASHGGAIGIIISTYLYNKKVSKKGFIWVFDRLVIGVALAGAMIRLGNLMNSEIYGGPTTLPWGFIFVRDGQTEPMHPTQIYEILYCLITFAITYWLYWKKEAYKRTGLIFGVFLIGIFLSRFFIEYVKNNQESFEDGMLLNMGQLLSIPFVIWGVWLIINSRKNRPAEK